jgi:2-polyprenyl-6-methoxyphenol hydroxylase-like FAD-dependent oxidoreductase
VAELGDEPFPGGSALETWGRGERFGLVKLRRRRVYWYATKNAPKGEENAGPRLGRKEELLAHFGGWHEPIPTIIRVTEDCDIHRDGVYYREPAKRWGEGRFTLLGDAAHPMTPDLGQGACQAIEDAVVLARSLDEEGDIEAALRLYEERRADRVAYVVRQSRRLGWIGQLENPLLRRVRDATLRTIPKRVQLSAHLQQMEPVVGYEV